MNQDQYAVETLESRQMLAAGPWSAQDRQIGLDQAAINFPYITGAGQTVAIIDHGVDYNHYALGGGFGKKVIAAWNFDNNTGDVFPYDNDSHGTGTAGELAGDAHYVNGQLYQGVAPGVKLIALRASGGWQIKQAFDWIVSHRAQYNVVAVNFLNFTGADEQPFVPDLQALRSAGVFVAGAVGNYGPSTAYAHWYHLIYNVGSVDPSDHVSWFTPRGPNVDMMAPAESITIPWYFNGQHVDYPSWGTSWAGPQITGMAALIKQINPRFTPDQILQIMRDSANWVYDDYSHASYPRLNVNNAIALAYQRAGRSASQTSVVVPAPTPKPTPAPASMIATQIARTEAPFLRSPFSVGDVVQVEDFNNGGEGVAYHDTTSWNDGNDGYRAGGVDTHRNAIGNREYVGWTRAGEWLDYSINVAKTGVYDFFAQVAASGAGGSFHINIDGKQATGSITVKNTGSWEAFATVSTTGLKLTAGKHVLRIAMDKNGANGYVGNFDWFRIAAPTATTKLVRRVKHYRHRR